MPKGAPKWHLHYNRTERHLSSLVEGGQKNKIHLARWEYPRNYSFWIESTGLAQAARTA